MHPVSAEDGAALGNLIQFTTSTREASKMDPADIDEFLFALRRIYNLKLAGSSTPMWFYAWFDAQAGQLCVSAAPATSAEELPFGCQLEIVESPTPVSLAFLNSDALEGICLPDGVDSVQANDIPDEIDEDKFVLTVFAQRLS